MPRRLEFAVVTKAFFPFYLDSGAPISPEIGPAHAVAAYVKSEACHSYGFFLPAEPVTVGRVLRLLPPHG